MNYKTIIKVAENEGYQLVPASENEYMIWVKDGKEYGSFIPNIPDYEYDAANEISPFLNLAKKEKKHAAQYITVDNVHTLQLHDNELYIGVSARFNKTDYCIVFTSEQITEMYEYLITRKAAIENNS